MIHLLAFWNYRISASLTLLTGVLLLWQFPGAKGTAGHIARWAVALFLSVFVVYMNTLTVLNQPPVRIMNQWHIRLLAFHQNVGLIYFALMALMPVLGGSLMLARKLRPRGSIALRAAHKYAGYAAGNVGLPRISRVKSALAYHGYEGSSKSRRAIGRIETIDRWQRCDWKIRWRSSPARAAGKGVPPPCCLPGKARKLSRAIGMRYPARRRRLR